MRNLSAIVLMAVLCLPACGGGSSPAAPAPAPAPTPTPAPSYSGTYSGTILENVAQLAEVRGTGTVRVTQNGTSLDFGPLAVAIPGLSVQIYQLGTAVLNGSTFTGTSAYNSAGCDVINVAWNGRFAGTLMNLTVVLTPTGRAGGCDKFEFRGELSR